MTDFDRYCSALSLLGLAPGTPIAEVRKTYRARMREVHPDRHHGDKNMEDAAKALNEARATLEAMSRDGRAQTFAIMAERTRRTGGSDSIQTLNGLPRLVVMIIMAPAGIGKTRGWVRSVAHHSVRRPALLVPGQQLHVILSSPTIDLIDQTARELAENGLRAPVVHVVHSANVGQSGRVASSMKAYFEITDATQDAVLLCSHVAIFDTPLPHDPQNWDIVFDEMPDCVSFLSIDAPATHVHVSRYVVATDLGDGRLYHLAPDADLSALERLARIAVNRPHDGGLEHLQDLARALIHGHTVLVPSTQWDELLQASQRDKHAGHLDVLVIVPPIWFQWYRSVTMMGARCTTHFTALVWNKIWRVEFREDNRLRLPRTHTRQQSRRLTIHWIFEERATRAFLKRKAAAGSSLFMASCKAVAQFYADRPFLWSAPQPGEDKEHGIANDFWQRLELEPNDAFQPALRLPGRTHGLNRARFLETCNVALLSVIKLTPAQYQLLYQMDLTDDEIDRALAFDVAYQDMARCNIRMHDGDSAIDVTVLDERTALELADKFPGCRVECYPEDLIPRGLFRTNNRGPAPSGTANTNTERSRAYRARQAALRAQRQAAKRES